MCFVFTYLGCVRSNQWSNRRVNGVFHSAVLYNSWAAMLQKLSTMLQEPNAVLPPNL